MNSELKSSWQAQRELQFLLPFLVNEFSFVQNEDVERIEAIRVHKVKFENDIRRVIARGGIDDESREGFNSIRTTLGIFHDSWVSLEDTVGVIAPDWISGLPVTWLYSFDCQLEIRCWSDRAIFRRLECDYCYGSRESYQAGIPVSVSQRTIWTS